MGGFIGGFLCSVRRFVIVLWRGFAVDLITNNVSTG